MPVEPTNLAGRQVPIFPIFWPASYFLEFFQEIPNFSHIFRILPSAGVHFEIFEIKFSIKLVNYSTTTTKKKKKKKKNAE